MTTELGRPDPTPGGSGSSETGGLRVAVVHEWFTRWAGSEMVLEQILACAPHADVFALTCRPDDVGRAKLAGRDVSTSFIQRLPGGARRPQLYLPLLPWAAERLDLRGYDLVISNSHCVAKGVITSPDCCHVAYVHSPARYAWDLQSEYLKQVPRILRPLWSYQMHRLRQWDALSSMRPDALACNSAYITRRISHAWRRTAEVIYPPVDVAAFTPEGERGDEYLTASRLVGYKRVPLIAEAFAGMPGRRLRVIGDGGDMPALRSIAVRAPNITVCGHVDRSELIHRMQRAKAFVFAAEEDFGIAPVEAMACGSPVIAYRRGGACESVIEGRTGVFFDQQTAPSIRAAIEAFESGDTLDPAACRERALSFSPAQFREAFASFLKRSRLNRLGGSDS